LLLDRGLNRFFEELGNPIYFALKFEANPVRNSSGALFLTG
jgi:hypothetical protein